MKRFALLIGLLLCVSTVSALTPLEAGTMEARLLIINEVTFERTGSAYFVDEASGFLSWYPRDDALQDVLELDTDPAGSRTVDGITFSWDNPERTEEFRVMSRVKTRNAIVPVRERVPFPIATVPNDVSLYLGEGEIIDQNLAIQRLAQELAGEKDDLYEVVFALADWTTTNVEYSLESLYEPAIQTSSEVLESRWGKCDELTALFISLNRALGIPARFVAGYSYTNSDLIQAEWGGHGWAEVWFPGVGWVPFDVTYGEYGYLDAGHVKLKVSDDAKENSVDYTASGRDFRLVTEPLDIFVTPVELARHSDVRLDVSLEAPYSRVGFGSAVMVLATVRNTKDYYVATRLDLARTSNTEMLSDTYRNVLLRPYETVTIPFLVKIDGDLDAGFRYEFPFRLISRLGGEQTITIDVRPDAPVYAAEQFEELNLLATGDAEAPFNIVCSRARPTYVDRPVQHECTVQGTVGDSLTVCKTECSVVDVVDGTFTLTTEKREEGVHTEKLTAKALGTSTSFFLTTEVVTPTRMDVDVTAPEEARMDDELVVEVRLSHTGASPEGIRVRSEVAHSSAVERVERMPATIRLRLPGRALGPGGNTLTVSVEWTDELGTPGSATVSRTITLTDASFLHKVKFFLLRLGAWLT